MVHVSAPYRALLLYRPALRFLLILACQLFRSLSWSSGKAVLGLVILSAIKFLIYNRILRHGTAYECRLVEAFIVLDVNFQYKHDSFFGKVFNPFPLHGASETSTGICKERFHNFDSGFRFCFEMEDVDQDSFLSCLDTNRFSGRFCWIHFSCTWRRQTITVHPTTLYKKGPYASFCRTVTMTMP